MVGSPWQTAENLYRIYAFTKLQPDMIGIGPYITHEQNTVKDYASGFNKSKHAYAVHLTPIIPLCFATVNNGFRYH